MNFDRRLLELGCSVLYYSQAYKLFSPRFGGVGSILVFHRVRPTSINAGTFSPNKSNEVTAEFFERLIHNVGAKNIDIINMSDLMCRVANRQFSRRFLCLTFDDGYLDNFEIVYPICKRLNVPATIYVTSGFISRTHNPWWLGIERLIANADTIELEFKCTRINRSIRTIKEKYGAFRQLGELFYSLDPLETQALENALIEQCNADFASETEANFMTWEMVAKLAHSELFEIGAHSISHPLLKALDKEQVERELHGGKIAIEEKIGVKVKHFAAPYGNPSDFGKREQILCQQVGFETAATAQNQVLSEGNIDRYYNLPRLNFRGEHQSLGYLYCLINGIVSTAVNIVR
jgi:peptidoglycan/xylan/chitin deacetylase (PgdA/CDA1 family)